MRKLRLHKGILTISSFLALLLLLAGCGAGNNDVYENNQDENSGGAETEDSTDEEMVEIDGLEYTMEVGKEGESIEITLSLQNTLDEPISVEFSSGHQFDIVIKDDEGNVLYDYAEGMMFTQAIVSETIDPGEELTFSDSWNPEGVSEDASLHISSQLLIYQVNGEEIEGTPYQLEKVWTES